MDILWMYSPIFETGAADVVVAAESRSALVDAFSSLRRWVLLFRFIVPGKIQGHGRVLGRTAERATNRRGSGRQGRWDLPHAAAAAAVVVQSHRHGP